MKFVCLDFETANSSRSSVCAIGISVYENGEMIEEVTTVTSFLCKFIKSY
ncbi:MAG: hypothetical protein SOT71_06380 [Romboutsia timonensis]|nr:hypothetical protein [Romboutsia timonensis]MDY2882263.1 hypothetical protein [Romboutsia timonensis]